MRTTPAVRRRTWAVALPALALLGGCDGLLEPVAPSFYSGTDECRITVWLKAYINPWTTQGNYITRIVAPAGGLYGGRTALLVSPLTNVSNPDRFLTDHRGNSSNIQAPARMHSQAEFSVARNKAPAYRSSYHKTGLTVGFDHTAAGTDVVTCSQVAPESGMSWNGATTNGLVKSISLAAAASNPCITGSPNIDYHGTLTLTTMDVGVRVSFEGAVDEYPSFEMYVTDGRAVKRIFVEPNAGGNPGALAGSANVAVFGGATICARDDQGWLG